MFRVSFILFHSGLGWDKHRKEWYAIHDLNICSSIFMKQQSRDYITFWSRGDHQSIMKHMEVNILNIIIMFWVEELQEMVHFIIINWFDCSDVCIRNRFRVIFNWKLWRVNLNITIINGAMIKSPHGSWNHRAGFGRRGPGFEVIFWRLAVPLSWSFICFFTMKGVELIHLYSNTLW